MTPFWGPRYASDGVGQGGTGQVVGWSVAWTPPTPLHTHTWVPTPTPTSASQTHQLYRRDAEDFCAMLTRRLVMFTHVPHVGMRHAFQRGFPPHPAPPHPPRPRSQLVDGVLVVMVLLYSPCVPIWIRTLIQTHTHHHTHTLAQTHTRTHTLTHAHTHSHTHTHKHTRTHTNTHTHTHKHTQTHTHTRIPLSLTHTPHTQIGINSRSIRTTREVLYSHVYLSG